MGRKPGERALGALEARLEEEAGRGTSQDVAYISGACATLGRKPSERALAALQARREAEIRVAQETKREKKTEE